MVSDVKRIVEEGHLGVQTYEQFVQTCLQRCASGDEQAVALFVFAKLVQPFCDYYLDQALSQAKAVAFRRQLLAAVDAYEAADSLEGKQAVLRETIRSGLGSLDE